MDPLARAQTTFNFKRRAHRFERLGASLAASDEEKAFRTLAELDTSQDREAFIRGMFGTLAQGDKVKAMLTSLRLADKGEQDTALMALVNAWIGPNDGFIEHEERSKSDNPAANLGREIGRFDYTRADLLALWARTLTQGKDRADLLTLAASRMAWTDPALAKSYGAELTGAERTEFDIEMLWFKPADVAWREGSALTDPVARARAQNMLLLQLCDGAEPALAAAEFMELPADQPYREMALGQIAAAYGMYDNGGAWAWLDKLSAQDASAVRETIAIYTPAEIGVKFTSNSEGYPVVVSISNDTPNQDLPLHPGDRILAISNDGQHAELLLQPDEQMPTLKQENETSMIDVQRMDLAKLTKFTQGLGTGAMQFRIAARLPGGGYSAPTIVQLTRHLVRPKP